MVAPLLILLMFGSIELGYYILNEQSLENATRSAARYAARLPLAESYSCDPPTVTSEAQSKIVNVAVTGKVDPSATDPKALPFGTADQPCSTGGTSLSVTVRCVSKDEYPGLWRGYDGDIPVVKVAGAVRYRPLFAPIAFESGALCVRSDSETPVIGL